MPNQPIRLTPITKPITAEPACPNPHQRATTDVLSPSRTPMMPMKIQTTSRITAPTVNAQKAFQNVIP